LADSVREFFEGLESRANPAKTAGMRNTYRFDVEGAGSWVVRVADGTLDVREGHDEADCAIWTSEENFLRMVNGEQNPMTAYMSGKLRISGDMGAAMKLQKLF
jgi:putative sterol carrier protein